MWHFYPSSSFELTNWNIWVYPNDIQWQKIVFQDLLVIDTIGAKSWVRPWTSIVLFHNGMALILTTAPYSYSSRLGGGVQPNFGWGVPFWPVLPSCLVCFSSVPASPSASWDRPLLWTESHTRLYTLPSLILRTWSVIKFFTLAGEWNCIRAFGMVHFTFRLNLINSEIQVVHSKFEVIRQQGFPLKKVELVGLKLWIRNYF